MFTSIRPASPKNFAPLNYDVPGGLISPLLHINHFRPKLIIISIITKTKPVQNYTEVPRYVEFLLEAYQQNKHITLSTQPAQIKP
jgi:hypothetical protein